MWTVGSSMIQRLIFLHIDSIIAADEGDMRVEKSPAISIQTVDSDFLILWKKISSIDNTLSFFNPKKIKCG